MPLNYGPLRFPPYDARLHMEIDSVNNGNAEMGTVKLKFAMPIALLIFFRIFNEIR